MYLFLQKLFSKLSSYHFSIQFRVLSLNVFLTIMGVFFLITITLSGKFIFDYSSVVILKRKITKMEEMKKKYTFQLNSHYNYFSSFLAERFGYYNLGNNKDSFMDKKGIGGKEKRFTEKEKKNILENIVLEKNKKLSQLDNYKSYSRLINENHQNLKKNYSSFNQQVNHFLRKNKSLIINFPTSMPFFGDGEKKIVIRKENYFFEMLGYQNGKLGEKILIVSPGKGNISEIKEKEDGNYKITIDHTLGIKSTLTGKLKLLEFSENSSVNKNDILAEVENGNKIIYKIIIGNKLLDPKNFIVEDN